MVSVHPSTKSSWCGGGWQEAGGALCYEQATWCCKAQRLSWRLLPGLCVSGDP
jgi:hypothetical protein